MSAHVTRSQGQAPFELTIANRTNPSTHKATSSPFPLVLDLSPNPTLLEVKKAVAAKIKHLKPERQRLTTEDKRAIVDDDKTLSEENVKTGDTLWVKDLGPQVAWRTVFLTEYVRRQVQRERERAETATY
jgi:very-long-chain enoyl-CoA reductase